MSEQEKVAVLHNALEKIRELTFADDQYGPPRHPYCDRHQGKYALIHAAAAEALREIKPT